MKIIVNIEAECEECEYLRVSPGSKFVRCALFNEIMGEFRHPLPDIVRCPACLAAEQEYKRLKEERG